MSNDGLRTSAYWKDRADEARAMADGMRDVTAKALMEDIAHKYELLAERAAQREASRR